MRYLTVTYVKKANGQIDEQVGVAKTIRAREIQTCNIIMDFKSKKVDKCIVDGQRVDTDWDKLYTYYQELYPNIVERLEYEADPVAFMAKIDEMTAILEAEKAASEAEKVDSTDIVEAE